MPRQVAENAGRQHLSEEAAFSAGTARAASQLTDGSAAAAPRRRAAVESSNMSQENSAAESCEIMPGADASIEEKAA